MRLSASLILLLAAALPLAAEDAVTPVAPAPAADPVPPPMPLAPTEVAPATVAETPIATPAPAPEATSAPAEAAPYVDPIRQAEAKAKAAKAKDTGKPWGFGASVTVGYDSNILLENSESTTATNAKGAATGGEVHGSYQIYGGDSGRLIASGSTEINRFPSESSADMIRWGGALAASTSVAGFDPGVVVGFNKFYLDTDVAANATTVNGYVAKVFESNVSILGVGSQYVEYISSPDSTGTTYDASYRHWFLLAPGEINKRLEVSWKIAALRANNADNAYSTNTPGLALNWRFGPAKAEFGTVDVSGRWTYEMRRYRDPEGGDEGERQRLTTLGSTADVWLDSWLTAGVYLGYAKRFSTVELSAYKRTQAGVRLSANW